VLSGENFSCDRSALAVESDGQLGAIGNARQRTKDIHGLNNLAALQIVRRQSAFAFESKVGARQDQKAIIDCTAYRLQVAADQALKDGTGRNRLGRFRLDNQYIIQVARRRHANWMIGSGRPRILKAPEASDREQQKGSCFGSVALAARTRKAMRFPSSMASVSLKSCR
jgi:hypothetical protein